MLQDEISRMMRELSSPFHVLVPFQVRAPFAKQGDREEEREGHRRGEGGTGKRRGRDKEEEREGQG